MAEKYVIKVEISVIFGHFKRVLRTNPFNYSRLLPSLTQKKSLDEIWLRVAEIFKVFSKKLILFDRAEIHFSEFLLK